MAWACGKWWLTLWWGGDCGISFIFFSFFRRIRPARTDNITMTTQGTKRCAYYMWYAANTTYPRNRTIEQLNAECISWSIFLVTKFLLKFFSKSTVNDKLSLTQAMAWCWLNDNILPEPVMTEPTAWSQWIINFLLHTHQLIATLILTHQIFSCIRWNQMLYISYIDGILPKRPYPPCLRMADRALLAGYARYQLLCSSLRDNV